MPSTELSTSALAEATTFPESVPADTLPTMHGLVYRGPGRRAWEERPRPVLREPSEMGSGRLQPRKLVTHRFALDDIMQAYETFEHAAREGALKVILRNETRG